MLEEMLNDFKTKNKPAIGLCKINQKLKIAVMKVAAPKKIPRTLAQTIGQSFSFFNKP